MSNFEIQMKVALSDDYHNLYPVTKAEQVLTSSSRRFVTDREKLLLSLLFESNTFDLLMNTKNMRTIVEVEGEILKETIVNTEVGNREAVRTTETTGGITTERTVFYLSDGFTVDRSFTKTCEENPDGSYRVEVM